MYGVLTRAIGTRDAGRIVYVLIRGQEIEYPVCVQLFAVCVSGFIVQREYSLCQWMVWLYSG
jgi:hypothetical protein